MKAFIAWFQEFTKGFSFLEKIVTLLLVMLTCSVGYDKGYSEPARMRAAQSTHKEFREVLKEGQDKNDKFHEASLAIQERNSDRLYDLLLDRKTRESKDDIMKSAEEGPGL